MNDFSNKNFGTVIAYLLPGVIVLLGLSSHSETLTVWLFGGGEIANPSFGGFMYSTLLALLIGLVCSTMRWMTIDVIHHRTGIVPPRRDFRKLQSNYDAYRLIEENHYQYYQFYANSLVASLLGYGLWRPSQSLGIICWEDLAIIVFGAIMFAGSRDTLRKYYARISELLED